MSRCFPFPPPGYDRKARPDDVDLIIKEKERHQQKKHKDKKDKDKKERSEKKEKERSERKEKERSERKEKERSERKEKEKSAGKHKEDKERKEKKHKDKKDKKKEKHKSSDENQIVAPLDNQNGKNLVPDVKPSDGIQEDKMLVELGKRVTSDGGATDNRMAQKISLIEQKRPSDNILVDEQNFKFNAEGLEKGFVGNFPREKQPLENGFVGNFPREKQNKVQSGSSSCQVDMVEKRKEGKEKKKERNRDDGKGNLHKNEDRDKNKKAEDKKRKKEKKKEKEKEKERSKEQVKEIGHVNHFIGVCEPSDLLKDRHHVAEILPKLKEAESDGFLHDNESRPSNMSRHAFSSHQGSQNGGGFHSSKIAITSATEKEPVTINYKVNGNHSSSQPVIKNARNMDPGQSASNITAEPRRPAIKTHGPSNGLILPLKRETGPCLNVSNVAKLENGRKIPAPHIGKAVESQRPSFIPKSDKKGPRINGIIEVKKDISVMPSVKPKVEPPIKPPHPDLKYLSQVLTVPPKVEWPQFDDEDWLFGCKSAKRPKLLESSEIERTKQVWAEATKLEPDDVIALPYVVPY